MAVLKKREGFRFIRLEIYNWGTFNKKIHIINPDGKTSLLTGDNGSGKTTMVDALLTLLVPNKKRNYNLAGTEKKRERSEKSYVQGAYGRITDEAEQARPQYLRKEEDYSVLMGVFRNIETEIWVTLVQIFWIDNGQVKKNFVVANKNLDIEEHFSQIESIKSLKKKLLEIGFRVEDKFNAYSKNFRKQFGFRSERAMDLFNQTVAIKTIGNLNEFVRSNMLEKGASLERIEELKNNYRDLNESHEAIIRAKRQLEQLEPLELEIVRYEKLTGDIKDLEGQMEGLRPFFAEEKGELLRRKIEELEVKVAQLGEEIKRIKIELKDLENRRHELEVAYRNHEIGKRIDEIKRNVEREAEKLEARKGKFRNYKELAVRLDLPPHPGKNEFYQSLQKAGKKNEEVKNSEALKREELNLQDEEKSLKEARERLDRELRVLDKLKSDINRFVTEYREYSHIDWETTEKKIENLNREKRELEESSDSLKKLLEQKKEVEKKIAELEMKRDNAMQHYTLTKNSLEINKSDFFCCRKIAESWEEKKRRIFHPRIRKNLPETEINLENIETMQLLMRFLAIWTAPIHAMQWNSLKG